MTTVGTATTDRIAGLRFLVGGYTASQGGRATGVSVVESDPVTHELAARTVAVVDNPSFLTVTDDRLYAVSEDDEGTVHAFARDGSALEHRWDAPSGGASPCHVVVGPSGVLLLANYVSGTVGAVALDTAEANAAAVLAVPVTRHGHGAETRTDVPPIAVGAVDLPAGSGPVAGRQDVPHAHQVVARPGGTVLVADLGGDAIHEYRIALAPGRGSSPSSPGSTDHAPVFEPVRVHRLPAGTGPRHMAWWGDDLLVSGELDGRVHRLQADADGTLRDVGSAPAFDGPVGETLLSHIEVDDAGRVFVAARGRDTITVLDARDDLRRLAEVPSGGAWPRHFARVDGFLLVANERSDAVAVLPLDEDGLPGAPVAQVPVGTPTCIVPID